MLTQWTRSRVAGGLAVDDAVAALTQGGQEAVERLMAIGAEFDRNDEGELLLGREGGHNARRVIHSDGDATGAEVMRALMAAVEASESVELFEARVVDLARIGERVVGVVAADGKKRNCLHGAGGGAGNGWCRSDVCTNDQPCRCHRRGHHDGGQGRCTVGRPRVCSVSSHGTQRW